MTGEKIPPMKSRRISFAAGGACLACALTLTFFPHSARGLEFPEVTPESQGLRSENLRQLSEYVRTEQLDVRAMIVLRHGNLVLEWYSGGVTRDHNHNVYSITKSMTATLTGLALEDGSLKNVDMTLAELFPKSSGLKDDPVKAGITLEDLLTMRSGLPCSRSNRTTGPERELFDRLQAEADRTAVVLDELSMVSAPGGKFVYGNIEPALVLAAIEDQSGQYALDYAKEKLFDPLDFENADWIFADRARRVPGGYGLRLRAIDLAKLGQLYLQGGQWDGRQILPKAWVQASTQDHTGTGYGYFWWIDKTTQSYSAKGVRGQRLEIYPELDLVFALTSDLPPEKVAAITKIISQNYILKAVASPDALPEDRDELKKLEDELELARDYEPASRKGLPDFRLPER